MQGRSGVGLTLTLILTQPHLRPSHALTISLTLGRLSAILPNRSPKSTSTLDLTLPGRRTQGHSSIDLTPTPTNLTQALPSLPL
jgi:hypothetical protein